jgi:AraC-like DNA-binding protein
LCIDAKFVRVCDNQPDEAWIGHDLGAVALLQVLRAREFIDDSCDRYVVGRCWVAFHASNGPAGLVVWGGPTAADVDALRYAMPLDTSPLARRLPRYLDVRRIEAADQASLASFADFLNAEKLAELVTRAAVVSTTPLGDVLVAGLSTLAPMPYEVRSFADPSAALAWLGAHDARQLADELDEIQASAIGTTPLIRDVRAYCAKHLHDADLSRAAVAFGVSERTMQRRLRVEGTSFQRELHTMRVEAAKRLLTETDVPIATIARAVGCASPQHFTTMFRRIAREIPTRWRARTRA